MANRAEESAPVAPEPTARVPNRTVDIGPDSIEDHGSIHPVAHDWRTLDPSAIRGEGVPVEELRFYRETIDEMLRFAAASYVLIVGREVINYFPDLESATRHAGRFFRDQTFLIKKVTPIEPIHTTGGVVA